MVNMRTIVGIDLVKSLVNLFLKISTVTSPALLVPPALKSEKKKSRITFFILRLPLGTKIIPTAQKLRRRNPVSEFL